MLQPVERELEAWIGTDYYDDWKFWQDDADTIPYSFTGWTQFTLVIGGLTLIEGSGLTIDHAGGKISPSIPRDVTAQQRYGTASYALSVIDAEGKLGLLMLGIFNWKAR